MKRETENREKEQRDQFKYKVMDKEQDMKEMCV